MSEFKQATIGDYITLQRGTTYKSKLLDQPGPVLLGLASIQPNGGFRSDSLRTYGGESPEKLILRPGELYVSLKDITQSANVLGAVSRVPSRIHEGRLTQDTVKLVFKNNKIPTNYLYWLLRTPQYRHYCWEHAIGTTNLSLSREDFLSFPVPELTLQRLLLVRLLEALDDKIELNREMNKTLEAMAQAIFKSWFVDFDPVRAKMEGRQPAGMDAATAELFPDEFEESALGMIPKGWKVKSLDQIAHFLNGLALQKYPPTDDNYLPVIKIAELRKGVTESSGKASPYIDSKFIIQDGDILFSWSGSLEVCVWCGGKGALNQHLFKVTSAEYPKWFYYQWIKYYLPHFQEIAASKATTMGHIQRHHLNQAKVIAPPKDTLEIINKIMEPLLNQFISNNLESSTLASIRNTLLPKLLSGEIRVKEAEKVVETVL